MSRPLITFVVINTFTTAFVLFYNLYVQQVQDKNKDFEHLLKRIDYLEQSVHDLQQTIEDLEENIHIKNNNVIQSNIALTSKLDDFINYSYDVYDD
jgi:predicted PurR-regulated permease PerM